MFNNFDTKSKLVWPNLVQCESAISNSNVNSNRRPDAIIRIINQHYYGEARGYGEIKTKERVDDKYDLVRDLVRCAVFGKEAIDLHEMNGNLYFQVVGINVFTEICHVVLPMSICDLPFFVAQLDDLLRVIKVYNKTCIIKESPIDSKLKRPTLNK